MKTYYSGTAPQIPSVSTLSRRDLEIIADMIDEGSRVLDVGAGNGALLDYLGRNKGVDGRGIELSQAGVNACVAHGLSVIQGDADTDLEHYPDDAFDFVVLTRTLQATRNPGRGLPSGQDRAACHCVIYKFRALAGADRNHVWRADARRRRGWRLLVRYAEHPSVHDRRFFDSLRRSRA